MKPGLLRCAWRVDTLWGLLIVTGMVHTLLLGVRTFGKGPAFLHPGLGAGAAYSDLASVSMVLFGFAAGLAMLIGAAMTELLACPFTWFPRSLQRAVRRDLALVFLVPVLLALPLALGAWPGETAIGAKLPLGLIGLPFLGMAVGLAIFDTRRSGTLRTASALTLFAVPLGMEHLLVTARDWPLALPVLGLLAFGLTLSWSLSRSTHRATLLGGELALGSAHRHPFAPAPWESTQRRGKLREVFWSAGPIRSERDVRRAIDFERWGWSRGTWPLGHVGPTGLCLVLLAALSLLIAQSSPRPLSDTLELLFALTWNSRLLAELRVGESGLLLMVTPTCLFLALLTVADRMQPALRAGHLYALSRRARAAVLWRGGLENWARVSAGMLLLVGGASALVGALGGFDFGTGPPYWLTSLACCFALLPLMQFSSSLREFFPGSRLPAWKALGAMILLAATYAGLLLVTTVNLAELHAFERWVALPIFVLLIPLGQLALRTYMRTRLSKMDLV